MYFVVRMITLLNSDLCDAEVYPVVLLLRSTVEVRSPFLAPVTVPADKAYQPRPQEVPPIAMALEYHCECITSS